jgi:hypothetical protein
MAGTSLLALIDDIATMLDDVSVMTKVATKKTAGVLGDDLALNAQQVTGVSPERELPVVWAVAKGSTLNKVILVPVAVAISYFAPWAVTPLLMLGGLFLCYEGVEKVAHKLFHAPSDDGADRAARLAQRSDPTVDLVAQERDKIKGAVRTDFILSAEIIVIALGTVTGQSLGMTFAVLAAISAVMTVGVYGLVAGIVKLDDAGLYLSRSERAGSRALGAALLAFAPKFMKFLGVAGTAAMFLVGGGIIVHGIGPLHHLVEAASHAVQGAAGGVAATVVGSLLQGIVGIAAGALALGAVSGGKRIFARREPA